MLSVQHIAFPESNYTQPRPASFEACWRIDFVPFVSRCSPLLATEHNRPRGFLRKDPDPGSPGPIPALRGETPEWSGSSTLTGSRSVRSARTEFLSRLCCCTLPEKGPSPGSRQPFHSAGPPNLRKKPQIEYFIRQKIQKPLSSTLSCFSLFRRNFNIKDANYT